MLQFDFQEPNGDGVPAPLAFDKPYRTLVATRIEEVLPILDAIHAATQNGTYAAGYLSYEAAPAFDPALTVRPPSTTLPLAWFGLYTAPTLAASAGLARYRVGTWQPDTAREAYERAIERIREAIRAGDIYQANYTMRLAANFSGSALAWYEDLKRGAHGRFPAFLDLGTHQLLSMSPELFFKWDGTTLTTRPMKGTARRAPPGSASAAAWHAQDRAVADRLLHSEKDRAENLMIVDLLRNDLSRVAKPNSVKVPQLFTLETYPTIHQLTSTVTAATRAQTTLTAVFRALFPCGSITGAPKIKSSEIIAALEAAPRGVYCGAIGYVAPGGNAVFSVAIRTIVVERAAARAECGVGGGVVWDSTPESEYEEALAKAGFLTAATPGFDLLETLRLDAGNYDWLERHLARLMASAAALDFPIAETTIRSALTAFAASRTSGAYRVRLTVDGSGTPSLRADDIAESAPPIWSKPASLLGFEPKPIRLATHAIDATDAALQHKTTRRTVYDLARRTLGDAFDTLLWNSRGELTEFTYGNFVLQIGDEWLTPPTHCGLLGGVLRGALLAHGDIQERVLTKADLARATSLWFINSVRGWVRVAL